MRRNSENRIPAARPEPPQIIEIFHLRDFLGGHIQHNHVCAKQTHLGRGNQQNSHCRRIGEHFLSIKDSIVQRDRENAKSKRARAFQQLMRRKIHGVFGIIERVNVQIDFDPILVSLVLVLMLMLVASKLNRESHGFHSYCQCLHLSTLIPDYDYEHEQE